MVRFDPRDMAGGILVAALGLAFVIPALNYPLGRLAAPGPGAFPMSLGLITVVLGLAIIVRGFVMGGGQRVEIHIRSAVAVTGAILAFALLIRVIGLVPTLFIVVIVSALGSSQSRLWPTLAIAAGSAAGGWLVFIVGLGLPIPAVRIPF